MTCKTLSDPSPPPQRLFEAGTNSKTWRLLCNLYDDYSSQVRLNQDRSPPFKLERSVCQGSILSPCLFLLVMNPLLKQLHGLSSRLSVKNNYAVGFLHADDTKTLDSSPVSLEEQISAVSRFTSQNFLKLNASKCEVIVFKKQGSSSQPVPSLSTGMTFPLKDEVKCLGYLWKSNLSSSSMVEERINKARKAFFQFGSISAFQGNLSPVSTSSVIETCVYPVLLYGVENWVLCTNSLKRLECFQGELTKRILKLPRWYPNTAACIALGWHSIHAICTIRKLKYLLKITTKEDNIAYRAYSSLVDDVESLCIVKECRELEGIFGSDYTSKILTNSGPQMGEIQDEINKKDKILQIKKASHHQDLCKLGDTVGWKKLWDQCLDQGEICVTSLVNLVSILTYPRHAKKPCPYCEGDSGPQYESLASHVMLDHTNSNDSWDNLLNSLCKLEPACYSHLQCLYKLN